MASTAAPEDVSADLPILASTPIIVVCAGARPILDLPRTLETLETWGVPVALRTDELPGALQPAIRLEQDLGLRLEVAAIFDAQRSLGLPQAILVTVPVPAADEVPAELVEPLIQQAVAEADAEGVGGRDLTPTILARMVALSDARTRRANESLLIQNADVAAQIAVALAQL